MAYQAGDTILDDEYNNFVAKADSTFGYNIFAGTTAASTGVDFDLGLGQTNISTVAATNTITAAQWNSLFTGITNIANHANISVTSAAAVSSGNTIAIKAALESDLGSLRTAIQGGCASATALTPTSALQTATTASEGWDTSATQAVRVTFTNANEMRWFFNAGGKVRITVGTTAASVNPKDTAFADLGTAIGNLDIGSKTTTRSGTGETLTTDGLALGFHDLTTSYQTILKLTSDNANYTSNAIEIQARLDAAVGTATYIEVQMTATDPSADDQYTAGNTAGVAAAIKDTPKMVTTLFTINPNTNEGLATAYTPSATTIELNTTA